MIQTPPSLTTQKTALDAMLTIVQSNLATAKTAVENSSLDYQASASASSCSAIGGIESALDALLQKNGQVISIHPWTRGAGENPEGIYSQQNEQYLSPASAMNHLANKMQDHSDPAKDGALEMVIFQLSGATASFFATQLALLEAVFPLPDVAKVYRRVQKLASMEAEKMTTPTAHLNPLFHQRTAEPIWRDMEENSQEMVQICRAYEGDDDPKAELSALIDAKISAISQAQTNFSALLASLVSPAGLAFYVAGSPVTMAATIRSFAIDDASQYSITIAFTSESVGDLQLLKEIFGL